MERLTGTMAQARNTTKVWVLSFWSRGHIQGIGMRSEEIRYHHWSLILTTFSQGHGFWAFLRTVLIFMFKCPQLIQSSLFSTDYLLFYQHILNINCFPEKMILQYILSLS